MEPLEGRAYNVLKYMNDSSVGEGNVSSTPRKEQYPKFYKALVFAATIAFTSASSERSFSKLKWVKTRLRSTMTDERLSSLMIMTCELDLMDRISNEQIIDSFIAIPRQDAGEDDDNENEIVRPRPKKRRILL
mmetsp:Transcript_9253/g.16768  ORF Transcript_9253/g.16768 Transcript_9253/m.16768 type:complete len:133 (+) Transcript_9253:345-743(+)